MKLVVLFIVIFLAFVFQSKVSIFGVSPDLTALLAYYFGIQGGATNGMAMGSIIGLCEDSIVGGILGPHILGKGMVGFFSSLVSGSLFRWTPLLGTVSVFILTLIDGIVSFVSRTIFDVMPASVSSGIRIILIQSLLNALAGFFIKPKNVD